MGVHTGFWNRAPINGALLGAALGVVVSIAAVAQPGRSPRLAPEALAKVHAAQAASVAAELKLSDESTVKLTEAFAAFQRESAENRPPRGGERPDWEAMRKRQEAQRDQLAETLTGFLEAEQANRAASLLAGFNRGWDRMVDVVLGFKLDGAKQSEALGHILAHVKQGAEARGASGDRPDMEAMRNAMWAARKELDEKMAALLSEAQIAEWEEKTSWTRRGTGRGGRGDRGDRRGDRNERGPRQAD